MDIFQLISDPVVQGFGATGVGALASIWTTVKVLKVHLGYVKKTQEDHEKRIRFLERQKV